MISRELHRPLYETLHRDLDRTGEGIGSHEGVTLVLTAPNGVYAEATAVIEGGIPPYTFIVNGVEDPVTFTSPTSFPDDLLGGDTVLAKDSSGNLSNTLTAITRTNYARYSEQFQNAEWQGGASVTVDAINSPIGTLTADLLEAGSLNTYQPISELVGVTVTHSIFYKKSSSGVIELYIFDLLGSFISRGSFDLDTGIATDIVGTGAAMSDAGAGWYRCSVTGTPVGTPSFGIYNAANVYAWGAQAEAGVVATPYIGPVLGTPLSR